jgi:hypothetical protein
MSNTRWNLLGLALISGSMLAQSLAGRSLGGAVACLAVDAFAAGILFRGVVDGRRRAREKADASVKDLVKVHRPGGEADEERD